MRDLHNASLAQGFLLPQLKQSVVSPIPKCPRPKAVEEGLRPISLTSQLAKAIKGFSLQLLMVQVHPKLDPWQFALACKSNTQALVYVLHILLEACNKGDCSARLFYSDFI